LLRIPVILSALGSFGPKLRRYSFTSPKAAPGTVITYSQLINSEFLPGRIDQLVIGILAGIALVYLERRQTDKPLPTRILSFSMYGAAIVVVLNIFWLTMDGDHIWQPQYLIFFVTGMKIGSPMVRQQRH
jgi:hypothetical protein